jgi:hypothetical protein
LHVFALGAGGFFLSHPPFAFGRFLSDFTGTKRMKEYKATALGLTVGNDGNLVRLELGTPDEGEIRIFLPAKNLPGLIPLFVKAEAEARKRRGHSAGSHVFDVSEVKVNIPADGNGIVISLILPQGLEGGMGFRVDTETARRLSATLAALVAKSGESPKAVQ